jgi:Putative restriction endonuclease
MPIYAQYKVPFLWLVDPIARTLEVFRLESGRWSLISAHADNDKVQAEPFQDIEIDLTYLWW